MCGCGLYRTTRAKCQYCSIVSGQLARRTRCIACQRRCVNQDINNEHYRYYCSKLCSESPKCQCGGTVWLDFGENHCDVCLNCMWRSLQRIDKSDAFYGRPTRVTILIKHGDEILVHKRGPTMTCAGMIALNSGTVDQADASSYETIIREMREEASIDITAMSSPIIRLTKIMYYIELNDIDYANLQNDLTSGNVRPVISHEYEIDMAWGYTFMNVGSIVNGGYLTTKYLVRSIKIFDRCCQYAAKSHVYTDTTQKKFISLTSMDLASFYDHAMFRIMKTARYSPKTATLKHHPLAGVHYPLNS
jgi:8-oxo-dGTP pyrophosphatase MutT (NUDIX family)